MKPRKKKMEQEKKTMARKLPLKFNEQLSSFFFFNFDTREKVEEILDNK